MKKAIVLAVTAASIMTAANVYAESSKNLCRPLLSTSYIFSGNVGSCIDPLVNICDKLGIGMENGIQGSIVVLPGSCIPESETTTESESNTEGDISEISTTEIVTRPIEACTTEVSTENITEKPNVPETTRVPETTMPEAETTQKPTTKPEISTTPEETTVKAELSYAEQVVQLVNKERAKAGLKELMLDTNIEAAAFIRAKETEVSFSHTRPNGSSFSTVLKENGISFRGAGENIAWGQKTPEQVMNGWMNSKGHRANILNPNYTKIGVGYYKSSTGRQYWTQLFIY